MSYSEEEHYKDQERPYYVKTTVREKIMKVVFWIAMLGFLAAGWIKLFKTIF